VKTVRLAQLNANYYEQKKRITTLVEAIVNSEADFVALQEVTEIETLKEELALRGYPYSSFSQLVNLRGGIEYVGYVSKHQLTTLRGGESQEPLSDRICLASATVEGITLNLFSAHFVWGGDTELKRTQQAELVEKWAAEREKENPNSISILAGDLNAEPDYRSIRYLSGKELSLDNSHGTLWTDAWVTAGSPENEITNSHSTNAQGRATAFRTGIAYPGFLPHRRIDYIFVRGWRYGKLGSPVSFGYITHPEGIEISDHNGIYADLLISLS